ncbi:T9SS type A sorting domain-containing protein [Pedobacter nanyangensis]|uniref:T9SS type A sorting domain-containing protein n=1 Tax=Pedobacter nanyangensis TaxID=1562389 RepID=UPI000DE41E62|nr:T9SS type A sorting domain-containing protein [Pedobacter nanyangensis]
MYKPNARAAAWVFAVLAYKGFEPLTGELNSKAHAAFSFSSRQQWEISSPPKSACLWSDLLKCIARSLCRFFIIVATSGFIFSSVKRMLMITPKFHLFVLYAFFGLVPKRISAMCTTLFLFLFCFGPVWGQSPPDSLFIRSGELSKGAFPCGVSAEYFSGLVNSSGGGGSGYYILPVSFPVTAIDTCGKFQVYYVDKAMGSAKGFDDPVSGANRRAVVCAVLSYVQSVIDMSLIPSGQYIRLYVDSSYTSSHIAPFPTTYFARAGAKHSPSATGVVNGDVHKFITSGTDPTAMTDYHAEMKINFDRVHVPDDFGVLMGDYEPVNYNDSLGPVAHCQIDFMSTVLHEITHTLGWSSYLGIFPSGTPSPIYSSIDTALHAASHGTSLTTLSPAFSSGTVLYSPGTYSYWVNGKQAPDNYPVYLASYLFTYTKWASSFAHMDDEYDAFAARQRISPGDAQDYVMGPFSREGVTRRTYTKGEIVTLRDVLGYTLNAPLSTSAAATNHVPWSSRMSSVKYSGLYTTYALDAFHEKMDADTILINDSGTVWTIHLNADTSLHDADGDPLQIYPGSLVNFRGCGEGGNNHASLTIGGGGTSITYTPRHNFMGRAQFGYNLYDGKEKGAFVMHTIDVYRGNNVGAEPGEELVLNGGFEEGTEVKVRIANESVNNTSLIAGRAGRLYGAHFADSHPFDYWAYAYMPSGGGCAIRNAYANCDSTGLTTSGFGIFQNNFPDPDMLRILPPKDSGDRYQLMRSGTATHYYLADTLRTCKRYKLALDYHIPNHIPAISGTRLPVEFGFTDTGKVGYGGLTFTDFHIPKTNYTLKPVSEFAVSTDWTHVEIPFVYCSDIPSDMLTIKIGNMFPELYLDNVSLVEDTSKFVVSIHDSLWTPCNNTRLKAVVENKTMRSCIDTLGTALDYTWTLNGDTISRDSLIYVLPEDTSLYKVAVYDGCRLVEDSIILYPASGPVVVLRDTSICQGDSMLLTPVISGTTGTVSYSWSPSSGLSCTSCSGPVANPSASTTYYLTVTDALGCFTYPVNITVKSLPEYTIRDTVICHNSRTALEIATSGTYTYYWYDGSLSCDTCRMVITPNLTSSTDYVFDVTTSGGCTLKDTVSVAVRPAIPVSIVASPPFACGTDPVVLTASGGMDYTWRGSPWIGCTTCASTPVNPPTDQWFAVAVSDTNACLARDSILVKVHPKPLVHAIAPSAVCQYSSATVSGAGASTYTWATLSGTTAGIACPTCPATSIVVMAPTYYVVTGTDTNGCSNKDTFLINVHSLPTVTVSPASVTICGTDSATLTAGGALSYTWSPTTGISCSTCNPVKVRPLTSPRTYVVTGTDANGCTNTASSVITTAGACACSPVDVFGTSATTLSGTFSGTFGAGYYYIPDNITITGTTTFTDAKVLIGKDVTVTVDNNAMLTLDHSHWFTCPDSNMMWQGIVLASGVSSSGRIEVRNNSLIEDAVMAIYANNPRTPGSGHIIRATSSVFNRNQLDISVRNYNPSTSTTYPFSVLGSVFTARAFDTVSGYPDNWPTASALRTKLTVNSAKDAYRLSRSYPRAMCKDSMMKYMGLRFEYVGATTGGGATFYETAIGGGNSTDSTNLFDNHKYGIFANRSNMTVRNSVFINMSKRYEPSTQPSSVLPDWGGLGIFARSDGAYHNRLRLTASGGNLTNYFHDCFEAIGSENVSQLDISSAVITTSHRAGETAPGAAYPWEIYTGKAMWIVAGTNYKQYSITSNSISNVNCGIYLYMLNPPAGAVADLNNNNFYAKNPDPAYSAYTGRQYIAQGIEAYCGGWGAANTLNINGNSMSMVWNGILFSDMHTPKTTVNANTITLWDTLVAGITSGGQYAIRSIYSQQATISGNTLYTGTLGPISTADRMRGVYAVANTDLRVCGNSSTNIGRAFEFAGPYAQTGTRWIGNTMSHAYKGMVLGTDIGDQGGMYNFVTMTPTYFWGATKNVWSGGVWGGGASRYQTIGVHPTSTMFSKLWVSNIPSGGSVERPTVNETTPLGMPPPYLYNYSGTSGSILISNAQWDANCQGGINPTVVIRDPAVGTHGGPRPLGGLILVDGLGYDEEFKVNQWMAQLSLYERATLMPDLRDSSATLDSFMTVAADSRFGWLTAIEQALAAGDTTLAETLLDNPVPAMDTLRVNGNILLTDYPEADAIVGNYEQYYRTYLRFMRETMDASDTAAIADLADRCPDLEGAVVYKARSLYSLMRDTMIIYHDDSCRYGGGQQRRVKGGAITGGEAVDGAYTLYPNPNTGSFTLTALRDKQVATAGIKVYSALGALVHQSLCTFNKGKVTLDIGEQAAGLYLLCIEDGTGTVTCLRFVIQ